jgi:hypothetical protein
MMSPFFSSPEFIASLQVDRERRLRQATRPRRSGRLFDGFRRSR